MHEFDCFGSEFCGEVVPESTELLFNLYDSVLGVDAFEFCVALGDEFPPAFFALEDFVSVVVVTVDIFYDVSEVADVSGFGEFGPVFTESV